MLDKFPPGFLRQPLRQQIVLHLRQRVVGIAVDSVSDVLELAQENVKTAPDVVSVIDRDSILGLGSLGDRMLILLDIERLMDAADMGLTADVE